MSTFDNRGDAFESKFAHDEQLQFKAMARRNKLLGLWAAEKMGIEGDEAAEYAKSVVRADFDEPGDEDVFRKIKADMETAKASVTEADIRRVMHDLLITAQKQILTES
ncbi:MAG: DUF1476 domain-containing protein [Rhizobiales bacterium]|nr:DUF1476 domain-containing protein [Hyphomicrobiales bacterium]